jgi:ABC-2 type transport system ATP-binding protein
MPPIVEARNLTKDFKDFRAVDGLSFSIDRAEVYGFLGQNGAGKSTTMRMLLGLIFPTGGQVMINGKQLTNGSRHLLRHTGAIIERPDMYGYLSGLDNLRMFGRLADPKLSSARIDELLELVGLKGREKDKVKAYSQGMKQRLGIAIALSGDPDLLILDEPTNGLDPQGIAEMRMLITRLSKEYGKTILISSHLLHEIEQVADRMLVLHKGKKIKEGVVKELLDPSETLYEIQLQDTASLLPRLQQSQWNNHLAECHNNMLRVKMAPAQMPHLARWLVEQGAAIQEIRSTHSLEAYFISLTHDATHTAGAL